MKIRSSLRSLGLTALITTFSLSACGKKEPTPTPTPTPTPAPTAAPDPTPAPTPAADAAPTPAPDAAPAPAPEADAAPAPAPDAAAADTPTAEDLAQKTGQPGWWAPMFLPDHKVTFSVKDEVTVTEQSEEVGGPSKDTVTHHTGEVTCTVKSVTDKEGGLKESEIVCDGYQSETGVSAHLDGRWRTDGKSLWRLYSGDPEIAELRFEHPPTAKKTTTEEEEIAWVEDKDSPGTWCVNQTITIGDGGVWTMCATEKDGPVSFRGLGGAALIQSDYRAVLKR